MSTKEWESFLTVGELRGEEGVGIVLKSRPGEGGFKFKMKDPTKREYKAFLTPRGGGLCVRNIVGRR